MGQPTQAGIYASGVSCHPNGAIKQFTYGNGITHTLTQNLRGLPDTSCDSYGACGSSSVLNDGYDYDANGNVAAISDGLTTGGVVGCGNRTMTYDGLDRRPPADVLSLYRAQPGTCGHGGAVQRTIRGPATTAMRLQSTIRGSRHIPATCSWGVAWRPAARLIGGCSAA